MNFLRASRRRQKPRPETIDYGPPLTNDDIADAYDKLHSGRRARTLPMHKVIDWAVKRTDLFRVHPVDDTIHRVPK